MRRLAGAVPLHLRPQVLSWSGAMVKLEKASLPGPGSVRTNFLRATLYVGLRMEGADFLPTIVRCK